MESLNRLGRAETSLPVCDRVCGPHCQPGGLWCGTFSAPGAERMGQALGRGGRRAEGRASAVRVAFM